MLKARFGQQLNKQFLGEIGVCTGGTFFDQQSGAAGCAHQRMIADDAMQLSPQAIHIRTAEAFNPMAGSGATFCGTAGAGRIWGDINGRFWRGLLTY
ncbi:MAG TPA: hypothetical protein VFX97_18190 [Pyrinomonadaceae bacterium]|nr:hypothetical protein [Pyrinomonadaceae bacterium]